MKKMLNCSIGDKLIIKKEIVFHEGHILKVGDYCIVDEIIGYGINLKTSDGFDIRLLDSDIPFYFKTLSESRDDKINSLIK